MARLLTVSAVLVTLAAVLAGCGPAQPEPATERAAAPLLAAESSASSEPAASPTPVVATTRTVTETQAIPFTEKVVNDPNVAAGTRTVRTAGVAGQKTVTIEVSYVDGVETGRRVVSEVVNRQPVTQVVVVGTKPASTCDPNYSGCVPIASDVDCAGGSGNGPAYVRGPVRVIGTDIYDLDRDGDGVACE